MLGEKYRADVAILFLFAKELRVSMKYRMQLVCCFVNCLCFSVHCQFYIRLWFSEVVHLRTRTNKENVMYSELQRHHAHALTTHHYTLTTHWLFSLFDSFHSYHRICFLIIMTSPLLLSLTKERSLFIIISFLFIPFLHMSHTPLPAISLILSFHTILH